MKPGMFESIKDAFAVLGQAWKAIPEIVKLFRPGKPTLDRALGESQAEKELRAIEEQRAARKAK